MRVFISYCHQQIDWVKNRLVPCLKYGGAEVIIDYDHFAIGQAVVGQMDTWQDRADKQLLVLSPDYLASAYCQHEMQRAIAKDPGFTAGTVLPVNRLNCALPPAFTGWNPPMWADLRDDNTTDPWQGLLQACNASGLGVAAPDWLTSRDDLVNYLERNESVNLLANGNLANWRGLLTHLKQDYSTLKLAQVDLQDPATTTREGLLNSIASAFGFRVNLPGHPHDLAAFSDLFNGLPPARLAISHFDLAAHRPYYDMDLFSTLRYLVMETRQLVLCVQSRTPFGALLPKNHPLSTIDIKTVELKAKP